MVRASPLDVKILLLDARNESYRHLRSLREWVKMRRTMHACASWARHAGGNLKVYGFYVKLCTLISKRLPGQKFADISDALWSALLSRRSPHATVASPPPPARALAHCAFRTEAPTLGRARLAQNFGGAWRDTHVISHPTISREHCSPISPGVIQIALAYIGAGSASVHRNSPAQDAQWDVQAQSNTELDSVDALENSSMCTGGCRTVFFILKAAYIGF
ncbi:hypothetical protein HYPSUDRAFT_204943 [Hypholoma sublateritium FD-334 SS-4]|uniref:Uncharacterized protein n=1 Tax=Hypholoma sublateritium (strain FD-334 SS-4) TaxID=945553 RepID=A0A0D2M728_HYPSF|nr:hypothetical protein HYPSUDRAFT_204943 [Hypholoma sublateritium FD-334 SS-4]